MTFCSGDIKRCAEKLIHILALLVEMKGVNTAWLKTRILVTCSMFWRTNNELLQSIPVLALPAPWARFLRRPLTAIQTHTKEGKGYNEITIY